jgi:hypothetical protein
LIVTRLGAEEEEEEWVFPSLERRKREKREKRKEKRESN